MTTLNPELKRRLEPRAASHQARLAAMDQLRAAGIPVTLLFAPVIPALNDAEMESILSAAKSAGAEYAAYILLRLPLEVRELFHQWLHEHIPLRAEHVISLIRQSRGGADNDTRFGRRMRGTGVFADLLSRRFAVACQQLGINKERAPTPTADLFTPPAPITNNAHNPTQGDLFQ